MAANTILAVDVGNSRIKFGSFAIDGAVIDRRALPECRNALRVAHGEPIPWDRIGAWLLPEAAGAAQAGIAGVHPAGIERLLSEWPAGGWPRPAVIRSAQQLPLIVHLDSPDKVGIDRLLNAVAANVLRPDGHPAIVVSSGTATTIDLVSPEGAFLGGAILPGLELAARSLHEHTALLPLVPVDELAAADVPALGRDTPGAIRSGILYGQIGAIKEVVRRLSAGAAPLVFVTGGSRQLLAPHLGIDLRVERDLPLCGLALTLAAR